MQVVRVCSRKVMTRSGDHGKVSPWKSRGAKRYWLLVQEKKPSPPFLYMCSSAKKRYGISRILKHSACQVLNAAWNIKGKTESRQQYVSIIHNHDHHGYHHLDDNNKSAVRRSSLCKDNKFINQANKRAL